MYRYPVYPFEWHDSAVRSAHPPSEYASQPVFEDAAGPSYTPADCAMRPNEGQQRTFAMYVHHFNKCGVRVQQGSDGKVSNLQVQQKLLPAQTFSFLYLNAILVIERVDIRDHPLPLTEGLRMAEDEYVMVLCKPQDRVATTHHVMDIRGTTTEGRSVQTKKVFRNGPKDMACRMSLMSRPQGTRSFNREMKSGATVRVGQDLQIRAVVKEGDETLAEEPRTARASQYPNDAGANSIDVGENAVYRDKRTNHLDDNALLDKAHLVFADGCRNPQYRAVALPPPPGPQQPPARELRLQGLHVPEHGGRRLAATFGPGRRLRRTGGLPAGVRNKEAISCPQGGHKAFCNGDLPRDKRKRRTIGTEEKVGTKNFTEDFQLKVTLGGFSQTPFVSTSSDIEKNTGFPIGRLQDYFNFRFCRRHRFLLGDDTSAAAIAIGSKRKGILTPRQEEELRLKKRLKQIKERK
ncbi:uncharacterized protein CEXT_794511 [Caerostris extrusa]|uniref:Uncharacterized protein n=1 Tax=Caerostris extrusa TaxID=172846 RepID=A0AAV4X6Z3_CAEEX|nr:uncharacterized protein CEXT_794511 [Caerostris extrusa]